METFKDIILVKEITHPIIIIVVSLIVYGLINSVIKKMYIRPTKKMEQKRRQTMLAVLKSVIKYIIIVIDLLLILNIYVDIGAILASLGVVSVILGLAMQDLFKDIISGVSIILEDQFHVGDWIKIGTFEGTVVSFGLRTTTVKAYTGEIKMISNRTITEITNYNMADTLAVVDVRVSYEANLEKVETVLKDLCNEEQDKIKNITGKIELLGIQELSDNGVVYRVIASCKSMQHYEVQRSIRKAIKLAFDKNRIKIPYQQVVLHDKRV